VVEDKGHALAIHPGLGENIVRQASVVGAMVPLRQMRGAVRVLGRWLHLYILNAALTLEPEKNMLHDHDLKGIQSQFLLVVCVGQNVCIKSKQVLQIVAGEMLLGRLVVVNDGARQGFFVRLSLQDLFLDRTTLKEIT